MDKVRIAVIGCGKVSKGHVRGWLNEPDRAEIVALVDVRKDFAESHQEEFDLPNATVGTDWREILERDDVDAVNLLTHGHLRTEMITAFLEAGKHIMTEKPTGWNLEECRRLRWYARNYPDLKVGVGYSMRYYPLNIVVRNMVRDGAIGRIMHVQASHNHPHDTSGMFEPRDPGAGMLSDSGGGYIPGSEMTGTTHIFDLMRFVAGEVKEVFAYRERFGTFVLVRFESGAAGVATSATSSELGLATPHVLCIQGTEGTIFTQRRYEGGPWAHEGYHGFIVRDKKSEPITADIPDTGHGDGVRTRNFLDAVQKDEPLLSPLEDSVGTSELLHAIWDSHNMEIRVPVHRAGKTG